CKFAQAQDRAVVLLHLAHFSRLVFSRDRRAAEDDVETVHRLVVLPDIIEALGRARVVIEGDAGADDVDKGRAMVGERALDQRNQRVLVAGAGTADIGRAEPTGAGDEGDAARGVPDTARGPRALARGSRELALGAT